MYMSFTKKDLQLLREILRPEFDRIYIQFEKIDQRFDDLKQYIDTRLKKQDIDTTNNLKAFAHDVYRDFHKDEKNFFDHEIRITKLEARLK